MSTKRGQPHDTQGSDVVDDGCVGQQFGHRRAQGGFWLFGDVGADPGVAGQLFDQCCRDGSECLLNRGVAQHDGVDKVEDVGDGNFQRGLDGRVGFQGGQRLLQGGDRVSPVSSATASSLSAWPTGAGIRAR